MKQFNLNEYLENPNKKIITREGNDVRIICTDKTGLNSKPIVALITIPDKEEIIETYSEDGVILKNIENTITFQKARKTRLYQVSFYMQ